MSPIEYLTLGLVAAVSLAALWRLLDGRRAQRELREARRRMLEALDRLEGRDRP